jgi:hypothetical protein
MKEHKCRGLYDPGNGSAPFWVYGYYDYAAPSDDGKFPERHIIHTDVGLMDVDPATVGEWVAKDKNGRDVYEGDALKQEDTKGVYIVFYNDKYYRFDVRHTYGFTMELSHLLREYKNETTNLDAEVVGNIYQNPELGEIHKREY